MPWQGGSFGNNPEWNALNTRIAALEKRLGVNTTQTAQVSAGLKTTPKRFRIAVAQVKLNKATEPAVLDVVWSSPLPSATYNVDVSCTAALHIGTPLVTNQTAEGCTITLDPTSVATGAVVVVLAIAPAPST